MAGECLNPKQCEFAAKECGQEHPGSQKTSGGREGAKTAGGRKAKVLREAQEQAKKLQKEKKKAKAAKRAAKKKDDSDDHKLTDGSPNSHSKSSLRKMDNTHRRTSHRRPTNQPIVASQLSLVLSNGLSSSVYSW